MMEGPAQVKEEVGEVVEVRRAQEMVVVVVERVRLHGRDHPCWSDLQPVVAELSSTTQSRPEKVAEMALVSTSPRGPSVTDYRRLSGQRHRRLPVHVEGQLNSVSRLQPRRSAKPIDSPSYQSSPISTPCT